MALTLITASKTISSIMHSDGDSGEKKKSGRGEGGVCREIWSSLNQSLLVTEAQQRSAS